MKNFWYFIDKQYIILKNFLSDIDFNIFKSDDILAYRYIEHPYFGVLDGPDNHIGN